MQILHTIYVMPCLECRHQEVNFSLMPALGKTPHFALRASNVQVNVQPEKQWYDSYLRALLFFQIW